MSRGWIGVATICALGAVAVTDAAASNTVRVGVRPAIGSPRTDFRVSFEAPAPSGLSDSLSRAYLVDAVGPSRRGCVSRASVPVGAVRGGQQAHITLATEGAAGGWCVGRFSGRVEETITPVCGFRKLCPDFIAMLTLGRFTFRVGNRSPARG